MDDDITVERLYDDRMWIITFKKLSRQIVDTWVDYVREYRTYQNGEERFLVYDASPVENMSFTNYLRQRGKEIADDDRDAKGRVAVVFSVNPMIRQLFYMFFEIVSKRTQPKLNVKMFNDRQQAIEWVEDGLKML